MALGCAFIFFGIIWLCRRRARKQREKKTALFATTPGSNRTDGKSGWRWRLLRFGEKLFGHKRSRKGDLLPPESESVMLGKLRAEEEARHEEDMVKLIGDYQYADSDPPEPPRHYPTRFRESFGESIETAPSMYSQFTGMPSRVPAPRQPLKKNLTSRFSSSTLSSYDRRI